MEDSTLYATVADVGTTLNREIRADSGEANQIRDWITKVQRRIQRRLGDLSALDASALRDVITEVVARRVKNPDGKKNERIDDYSYGLTDDMAKAGLYITEAEWADLMAGIDPDAAFTINPVIRSWAVSKPGVVLPGGDWQ